MKIKHLLIIIGSLTVVISAVFLNLYLKKTALFDQLPVLAINRDINELETLFTYGNGEGNSLKKPIDIVHDSKGRAFVVDSENRDIKVYDSNGKFLFLFGKGGENEDALIGPAAITIHNEQVLVSEPAVGRIQAFSLKGKFIRTYFTSPSNEKFAPVGMASIDDNLLFADVARHRIVEIDSAGKVVTTFGSPGAKNGEFAYPQDIAIDKNNKIYVSDSNNGRVQVFDRNGKHTLTIDGTKGEKEKMSLPRGITIDSLNHLIVVDTLANQIRFFELTGEPLFEYGEQGLEDGQLNFPNGISMNNNKLFVTDRENNRVQVFSIN